MLRAVQTNMRTRIDGCDVPIARKAFPHAAACMSVFRELLASNEQDSFLFVHRFEAYFAPVRMPALLVMCSSNVWLRCGGARLIWILHPVFRPKRSALPPRLIRPMTVCFVFLS